MLSSVTRLAALVLILGVALSANAQSTLYWTDGIGGKIYRMNLADEHVEIVFSDSTEASLWGGPSGLALDTDNGMLYWAQGEWIHRSDLEGDDVEDLVPGVGVSDLALDLVNGKMYWTTWGAWGPHVAGGIFRSNLDGTELDSLFYGGCLSIALDVDRNRLFFTDNSLFDDYMIRVARLDASWAEIWSLEPATAIAFDPVSETMYYYAEDAIRTTKAYWEDMTTLMTGISGLQSLSLDLPTNKIYWTEMEYIEGNRWRSTVRRANLNGSQIEDVVVADDATFGDVLVVADPSTGTAATAEQPVTFALYAAYPNPFNPSTTIRYTLASAQHVTIKIRDALGRLVAILIDEVQPMGSHNVKWNTGPNTPSGTYFFTLETNEGTMTRSVTLLR